MTGKPLALTPRDRQLLMEVQRHGALTRLQILRLRLFASKTRANARLKRLTDAGYLVARPQPLLAGGPRFVYLPGRLDTVRPARNLRHASDLFLDHHLGLVDLRLAFEAHVTLQRWLGHTECATLKLPLIPDAYLEYAVDGLTYAAFLEYDRGTEPLGRLEQKARAYVDLAFSGVYERVFHRRYFRALFVTDTDGRLATMSTAIARITDRVIRLTTRPVLLAQGPCAAIWRRPGADTHESLTPS